MLQPPHEVRDQDKLAAMVELLDNAAEQWLPYPLPLVVRTGEFAITGSHRIAALNTVDHDWYVDDVSVEVDDNELAEALSRLGVDSLCDVADLNELCEVLHDITDSDEVRQALADQF